MAVETLCSSSLAALDIGVDNLTRMKCSHALVSSTNLLLRSEPFQILCGVGAMSPDSRCKTFDIAADGMSRGEATAAVVLQYSVASTAVSGVGLNQDGASASMTAPNGLAQAALIRDVWQRLGGASNMCVACIETHGTGTALGDSIEVGALQMVMGVSELYNDVDAECLALGAIKTQMGHTEGTAGLMGLLKTVTALSWCSVSPNLHLKQPNTKIEIKPIGTKVLLQSEVQSLLVKSVLLSSGVSAFGMSGTNGHAVLGRGAVPLSCISLKSSVNYQLRAFDWWGDKDHSLAPAQSVSDTGFVDAIQSIMPPTCSDMEIALQVFLQMLVEQQVGQMVSLHDPLMQVGLTSTKAIKLVTLLQAQLGLEGQVDVFAIFNYPTVCQLAAHIFEFADLGASYYLQS